MRSSGRIYGGAVLAAVLFVNVQAGATLLSVDFDDSALVQTQSGFSSLSGGASTTGTQSLTVGAFTASVSGQDGFYNRALTTTPLLANSPPAFTYADLYTDFAYINNANGVLTTPTITISISGVTPNAPYFVTLYSYDQGPDGLTPGSETTTFAPGVNTSGTSGTVVWTVAGNSPIPAPTSNGQYATTLTLTSTTGVLTILASATAATGGTGYLRVNGFAMDAVPEPSTVVLFALGGLVMLHRRK